MDINVPTALPVERTQNGSSTEPQEVKRLDATHASVQLDIEGINHHITAPYKEFSTGSKGFYSSSKVDMGDGRRYQVGITVVRIGSKSE